MSPESAARFAAGVAAFDRGDFFAAHEEWEHPWRYGPTADRPFLHSLIQAAVALYQWNRGNRPAAERMARAGRAKAAGCPPVVNGLDLPRFWTAVDAALAAAPGPHVPLPRIRPAGDGITHD
ncbi:MAG: DUF309 domain-containing protein [Fimbriiglobus sp.]